jgi:LAO/AO transport system kinase
VVNKADLPGARKMALNVTESVRESHAHAGWSVPVLLACQDDAASIAQVSATIDQHQDWLRANTSRQAAVLLRERHRTLRVLERTIRAELDARPADFFRLPVAQQMANVCSAVVRQLDHPPS